MTNPVLWCEDKKCRPCNEYKAELRRPCEIGQFIMVGVESRPVTALSFKHTPIDRRLHDVRKDSPAPP